jgi:hypothetical protein
VQDRSRDVMDPWIQGISIVGSRVDHGLDQSRADHPKDHEKDDAAQSTHAVWLLLREPA